MKINNVPSNVLDRVLVNGGGTLRTTYLDPNHPNEAVWTDEDMPTTGYYVGVYNIAIVKGYEYAHNHNAVRDMLNSVHIPGFNDTTYFLGFWRDATTGTWYIDVSQRFLYQENALDVAGRLGELAIWDIKNNIGITI